MSSLNIPEEDIESLFSFSQFSEEIKTGVYKILEEIKLGDHPKKISEAISEKYEVDYDDVYSAITFYFNLLKTIYQTKMNDDEIVAEIINGLVENDFDFDAEDIKNIENTIRAFINIKSEIPLITSLAFDMALSTDNLFLRSFIYEDLRPIFFNEKISGLALYHTFRLHFRREDRDHTDLHLTIDSEDIDDLIAQLTVAKNRTIAIKEQYGDSIIEI